MNPIGETCLVSPTRPKHTDAMAIGVKIKQARVKAEISQAGLARALGIKPVNVSQWESGTTRPDVERLPAISKVLGVTVEWLLSDNLNHDIGKFVAQTGPRFTQGGRDFPVLGTAEAGDGTFTVDTGNPIDFVNRPIGLANRKDAYGIYVQGVSMQPMYDPGDLVYVDPRRPPPAGRDCIIQLRQSEPGGEMRFMLKRLVKRNGRKWTFKQYNPEKEIELTDEEILAVHLILKNHEML
jgi:phage repressor protein C with HTH and peptisase S24 domain